MKERNRQRWGGEGGGKEARGRGKGRESDEAARPDANLPPHQISSSRRDAAAP